MMVTSEQIDKFERDGYLGYGPILSSEEVNVLLAHLLDLFARENLRDNTAVRAPSEAVQDLCNILQGVVDSHSGKVVERLAIAIAESRTAAAELAEAETRGEVTYKQEEAEEIVLQLRNVHQKDDVFAELVRDERILDIAESFLGPNIQVSGDQALLKPALQGAEFPWHADNGYWANDPPNLITCWIALADVTEANGALRFVPGSHKEDAVKQRPIAGTILQEMDVDESRAITVELPTGGCSWHHCLTQHQSKPNRTPNPRPSYSIIYMSTDVRDRDGKPLEGCPLVRGVLDPA